jgi:hypothetical protein
MDINKGNAGKASSITTQSTLGENGDKEVSKAKSKGTDTKYTVREQSLSVASIPNPKLANPYISHGIG